MQLSVVSINNRRKILFIALSLAIAAPLLFYIRQQTNILIMAIIAVLTLTSFLWSAITTYRVVGILNIAEDYIKIQVGTTIREYELQSIKGLIFRYNGYAGKPYGLKSLYLQDGTDNIIQIEHTQYRILVEWEHIIILNQIFNSWWSKGIPFELYNAGKQTTKLERLFS